MATPKEEGATRSTRSATTREKTTQKRVWTPPSALDAPPAPDGFTHRWIRVESRGHDDMKNASGRIREGFEPVRKDEYPDFEAPVVEEGKYKGIFGVGGLVLMRIPVEISESRREYFDNQTRGQMQSVDTNLMKENSHETMRIQKANRSSKTTFGGPKPTN